MFGDSVKGEMALVNPRPPPFVTFRQTPPGWGIMMAKIVAVVPTVAYSGLTWSPQGASCFECRYLGSVAKDRVGGSF